MDLKKEMKKRLWFYKMFFIIFILISILKSFGLYEINNNIINSFTIGTFLFTISDLFSKEKVKNLFLLFGMIAIIALPNCNYILNIINKFISQDILMLLSLSLVFFSLTTNEEKSFYNERQEECLNKSIKINEEQSRTVKNSIEQNIKSLILAWSSTQNLIDYNISSLNKILENKEISDETKESINDIIKTNNSKMKDIDEGVKKFKEYLKGIEE